MTAALVCASDRSFACRREQYEQFVIDVMSSPPFALHKIMGELLREFVSVELACILGLLGTKGKGVTDLRSLLPALINIITVAVLGIDRSQCAQKVPFQFFILAPALNISLQRLIPGSVRSVGTIAQHV